MRAGLRALAGVGTALLLAVPAEAQFCQASLCFDGEEPGVVVGASELQVDGSRWSGGIVARIGDTRLYRSGCCAYIVAEPLGSGAGEIRFEPPATHVELAFMHGGLISNLPPATATAYAADGRALEMLDSVRGSGMETPLVSFATEEPIARITLSGGAVDDFSFETVPEPGGVALGLLALGLAVRASRTSCGQRARRAKAVIRRIG